MSLHHDCVELFGHSDLYKLFGLKKAATPAIIKKAYYKLALAFHPDRFTSEEVPALNSDEEEEDVTVKGRKCKRIKPSFIANNDEMKAQATKKFQVVSRAFTILSTPELKEAYDSTGSLDENDTGSTDWVDVFKAMFKEVNEESIRQYMSEYIGSIREINDVKDAYIKCNGNMNLMYEYVIGLDVETEDRIREVVWYLINNKRVEPYDIFVNEPKGWRKKRVERAEEERKKAKKETKKLISSGKSGDLFQQIRARKEIQKVNFEAIINKYSKKTKKRKHQEEDDDEE